MLGTHPIYVTLYYTTIHTHNTSCIYIYSIKLFFELEARMRQTLSIVRRPAVNKYRLRTGCLGNGILKRSLANRKTNAESRSWSMRTFVISLRTPCTFQCCPPKVKIRESSFSDVYLIDNSSPLYSTRFYRRSLSASQTLSKRTDKLPDAVIDENCRNRRNIETSLYNVTRSPKLLTYFASSEATFGRNFTSHLGDIVAASTSRANQFIGSTCYFCH